MSFSIGYKLSSRCSAPVHLAGRGHDVRQTQTIASTMFVRTGGSAGGQRQTLTQRQDTSKLWVVVSILKSVSGTEPPDTAARVYQGGEVSGIL